jgi:hypothetical protein
MEEAMEKARFAREARALQASRLTGNGGQEMVEGAHRIPRRDENANTSALAEPLEIAGPRKT